MFEIVATISKMVANICKFMMSGLQKSYSLEEFGFLTNNRSSTDSEDILNDNEPADSVSDSEIEDEQSSDFPPLFKLVQVFERTPCTLDESPYTEDW